MKALEVTQEETNDPQAQTIQEQLKTFYYDLVMLALANAAYEHESKKYNNDDRKKAITQVINALPPLPSPDSGSSTTVQGYWQMDWGPAISRDNSNLLYLASFRESNKPTPAAAQQNAPCFFVVGIRGTNASAKPIAIIQQIIQDIYYSKMPKWLNVLKDAPNPYNRPLPKNQDLGKIAQGSALGFKKLIGLTASTANNASKLVDLITALKEINPEKVPIMVTGHSLGGCQTQAIATYLAWQLDNITNLSEAATPPSKLPTTRSLIFRVNLKSVLLLTTLS